MMLTYQNLTHLRYIKESKWSYTKGASHRGSYMKGSRWWECWSRFIMCNLLTLLLTVSWKGPEARRHWENISERNIGILEISAMAELSRPRWLKRLFQFHWACWQSGRGHGLTLSYQRQGDMITIMDSSSRVVIRMSWLLEICGVLTWWQAP